MHYSYKFGPFDLQSELEMPRLPQTPPGQGRLVQIRRALVADRLAQGTALSAQVSIAARHYLLDLPCVARYLVSDGAQVTVEIAADANMLDVTAYLTTWVFGALCHQNGLLPIHASAVSARGRVTAFAADSGTGKSTLAACLAERGCMVLADDIALLELDAGSARPSLLPVAPWLKLRRESAETAGLSILESARTFSDEDKYCVPLPSDADAGGAELRLDQIVFLTREDGLPAPVLTPCRGVAAMGELMSKIYLGYIADAAAIEQRIFEQCGLVLRHARAFHLQMPAGLDRLGETLDALEPLLHG